MTTREVGVVTPMSELCLIVSDARTQQAYLDTVEGEMITVNIWPGIPQAIGDTLRRSSKIPTTLTAPEEYVSWWPVGEGSTWDFLSDNTIPGVYHTFDQDQSDEGTKFHVVAIDGLDESAARAYWDEWKADGTCRLFHKNCSTTVAKLLAAGNHDTLTLNDNTIWTPFGVWQYANTIYFVKSWF